MNKPDTVPEAVKKAYATWVKDHKVYPPPLMDWDSLNVCYFFWHSGVYYGVELDGNIHT